MNKKLLWLIFFTFLYTTSIAQNVGIGTTTPQPASLLDVSSTSKGVLVPRMKTAQMNAIESPTSGLLVFNTDLSAFAYYKNNHPSMGGGGAWVFMNGSNDLSTKWSTKGNAGTNAANDFIGTTDDVDLAFRRNNQRAGLISFYNSSFGFNAFSSNTTGNYNTAIGSFALYQNTTGEYNTAIGIEALNSNTSGIENTANGAYALASNTTGNLNSAYGEESLVSNTTGGANTANGYKSLFMNTVGNNNTANGYRALYSNTT